jgi:hypothetical protein
MAKKVLTAVMVLILGGTAAFAGKAVGEITYVAGDVTIARAGEMLSGKDIVIGDPIEDFDLIRTGPKGTMDLTLRTPQKQQIRLKVQGSTSFSIETAKLEGGKDRTTLQMMSGTLACKVDKLSGNELAVKTKSAAMGVKGTDFTVTTSPTDDVFVTCDEGVVSCVDEDSGEELTAEPGEAVERPADESLAVVEAPRDRTQLELFRQKWLAGRLDQFKRVAARHILGMAKLFNPSFEKLRADYAQLRQKMPILQKWIDQDKKGVRPANPAEMRKENLQILSALLKVKVYLAVFEPLFFRLNDLQYYYTQGYGSDDPAVGKFFADFEGKKNEILGMIVFTRYIMRIYADRNDGYFPLDDIGDSINNGLGNAKSKIDSLFPR